MKGEKLGKLLLDGLLVAENGYLIVHDYAHVGPESVHVLTDGDLGLILVRIESGCQVLYLVLQCCGRIDRVLLLGWLWWWGLGG